MKKISISEDNRGVSKLLVIGIIIIVVIAALAGIGYYYLSEKSATINFAVDGAAYEDSDVVVYMGEKEIYRHSVEAQHAFEIDGSYKYIFTEGDSKEITMTAKILDKDKHVIQTVEKTLTISVKNTYDVELAFPTLTLKTIVKINSTVDSKVTVTIDGEDHDSKDVAGSPAQAQFTDTMMWQTSGELSKVSTVKVFVEFSDGKTLSEQKSVTIDVNVPKETTFEFNYADA